MYNTYIYIYVYIDREGGSGSECAPDAGMCQSPEKIPRLPQTLHPKP